MLPRRSSNLLNALKKPKTIYINGPTAPFNDEFVITNELKGKENEE